MSAVDLPAVQAVTEAAFARLEKGLTGHTPSGPMFSALMFRVRFAADPAGCMVATDNASGDVVGALISVARGSLGWFGPLAVAPSVQGRGIGQTLVTACADRWAGRGVRLAGLETLGNSAFHVHLYSKSGFRPAWTGVSFVRSLPESTSMPAGVSLGGPLPNLDFLLPGLDLSEEVRATAECGAGVTLTTADGMAICHLEDTFAGTGTGFVPFLAAVSADSFRALLSAAEHVCREHGHERLFLRVPGASFLTVDALSARGYRAGQVMVRMKRGTNLDYDAAPVFCADSWL